MSSSNDRRRSVSVSLLLLSLLLIVQSVDAFCPSQCQCNDHALEADCAGSRLDVVPILLNPALRSLRLAHNRIATIRQSLDFYADLELLDLSHNALTTLGQRQLASQTVLRVLNVSHNGIGHLDSHVFLGLAQLQVLDLGHNQLTAIDDHSFSELGQLIELDLSANHIQRLSDQCFAALTRLRSLNLRANRLQQLAPSPSWTPLGAALLVLDLSHNALAQLDGGDGGLSALSELRQLNLSNNTLHHIHYAAFDGLGRLAQLDLSHNRLEYVPSDALTPLGATLKSLDLSGNYMTNIGAGVFAGLVELDTLRLSDVATLESIDGDALTALNATLQTLVLSNNKGWRSLEPQLLAPLTGLRYVDLSGSGLETVSRIDRWPPHLEHFDLSGNPLQCNCSMHWLWQHRQHQMGNTNRTTMATLPMKDIVCQGPDALAGRHFFQLEESHLLCWSVAQIIIIALVTVVVVAVLAAVTVLCCWRHRRALILSQQKHCGGGGGPSSTSSTSSSTTASHHLHHPTTVLHPHHVKHLSNTILHPHHIHHHHHPTLPSVHHHHHHLGGGDHCNHLDELDQHLHNHYQQPDSPPLKSKTLSFPKTVDYFLNEDDYVYHPGNAGQHIKPIPVTAV